MVLHLLHAVLNIKGVLDLDVAVVVHGLFVALCCSSKIVDQRQVQVDVDSHTSFVALTQAVEGFDLSVDRTHLEHAEGLVAIIRQSMLVDVCGTVKKQCGQFAGGTRTTTIRCK
jgi:hypothetical protein